jgi:hypothetical protein
MQYLMTILFNKHRYRKIKITTNLGIRKAEEAVLKSLTKEERQDIKRSEIETVEEDKQPKLLNL